MLLTLLTIFTDVLLPILAMVGLGVLVQRFYPLHMPTLSKLTIYLLVPAFLFVRVFESRLAAGDVARIAVAIAAPMVIIGVPLFVLLRARKLPGGTIAAIILAGVVFNAGNFGIPVARLHYGPPGEEAQAWVVMFSNISIWLIGYVIIQLGKGHGWRGAMGYFKLPMIYVMVAALAARWLHGTGVDWPAWADGLGRATLNTLRPLGEAVVPVGLVTLGAQLAHRVKMPNWKIVAPVVMIKLIIFPAVAALLVWTCGLWPWPGAQVIIGCAAPTAVNTLILTVELDGDAETAADSVFWTTVFSAVSVTLTMWVCDLYYAPGAVR